MNEDFEFKRVLEGEKCKHCTQGPVYHICDIPGVEGKFYLQLLQCIGCKYIYGKKIMIK